MIISGNILTAINNMAKAVKNQREKIICNALEYIALSLYRDDMQG